MTAFIRPIAVSVSHKSFTFETDATFRGLTITPNHQGYNIILRGLLKGRTPVYAMTVAVDIAEGLAALVESLSGAGGAKLWHFDKFADYPSKPTSSPQLEIKV